MTEEKVELAFPMAPIIRVMRKNMDKDKIIRSQVKVAMNKWLERMVIEISKKMNEKPYTSVDYPIFKEAVHSYEVVGEMEKEKKRIVANLNKIKEDCDSLIRDLDRKFDISTG